MLCNLGIPLLKTVSMAVGYNDYVKPNSGLGSSCCIVAVGLHLAQAHEECEFRKDNGKNIDDILRYAMRIWKEATSQGLLCGKSGIKPLWET